MATGFSIGIKNSISSALRWLRIIDLMSTKFVSDQSMNIGEDFVNTDTVGYIAYNRDFADGTETFTITGGDSTAFSINNTTGEIKVIDDTQLDNGTDPTMSLSVKCTLSGYSDISITVTINVYAVANSFYVDSSVSSSGTGTKSSPWKEHSDITGIVAGDLVMFKRGLDYFVDTRIYWTTSGTSGSHVVFSDYGSGTRPKWTVIAEHSHSWVNTTGNIWRDTSQTDAVKRLKIDGVEILGSYYYSELGTNIPDLVQFFHGDDGNGGSYLYIYSVDSPALHTLEYSDANSAEDKVVWNYADYVDYENIEFEGGYSGGLQIRNSSYVTVTNCKAGVMCGGNGFYLYDSGGVIDNVTINNCILDTEFTLDYSGTIQDDYDAELRGGFDGIRLTGCTDSIIKNNYCKNWGHASIALAGTSGVITNNKIYSNTMTSPDICYGGRFSVEQTSHNNEIYNNLITNTSVLSGVGGYNNHFHHNIIKDVTSSPIKTWNSGHGLQFQGGNVYDYNNIIENNLIINTESAGIELASWNNVDNVINNIIRNNIVYNCGWGVSNIGLNLEVDSGAFSNDQNTFQNNLVYNSLTTNTVSYYGTTMTVSAFNAKNGDSHNHTIADNIADDPKFVNAVSDWHLQSSSPAINAGITPLATKDYDGNEIPYLSTDPDIGVYEYQG